jgi:D-glycero-D-manno-heptose 1,7-bisphosphate phosphatase
MKTPALFLDRDGTINDEVDFLKDPDQVRLLPDAASALRNAITSGFKLFIVTNQSGIARGLLTEERLHQIHDTLLQQLQSEDVAIDGIYYCPHHPEFGNLSYRKDCECRKPKSGMIVEAARTHNLDLSRSYLIGDRMIDVQTGINIGLPSILVLTGYGKQELKLCREHHVPIFYVAQDLTDAVQYIRQSIPHSQPTHCS